MRIITVRIDDFRNYNKRGQFATWIANGEVDISRIQETRDAVSRDEIFAEYTIYATPAETPTRTIRYVEKEYEESR